MRMIQLAVVCVAVLIAASGQAVGAMITIDFETFPGPVPAIPTTLVTTQYQPLGVLFSGAGPVIQFEPAQATSGSNILQSYPPPQSLIIDFLNPTSTVGGNLISVGESAVTLTAYAADLSTILDTQIFVNPGTGTGPGLVDPFILTGPDIWRVTMLRGSFKTILTAA